MDEGPQDWKENGSGNQTGVEIGFRGRIGRRRCVMEGWTFWIPTIARLTCEQVEARCFGKSWEDDSDAE